MKIVDSICTVLLVAVLAGCSSPKPREEDTSDRARIDRLIDQNERALEIIAKLTESPSPAPAPAAPPVAPPVAEPTIHLAEQPGPTPETVAERSAITGRLRSIGSDTMDRLLEFWQTDFLQLHPHVGFHHQGQGSSTAIPGLIQGKADFGPMSRKLKESEIAQFKAKFGYEPVLLRVAVDAVAVYVHLDNPLAQQGLTFKQLDAIFSETRLRGGAPALTWGDLGLAGIWSKAPLNVYSRNSASGTYSFFKNTVLTKDGAYSKHCKILAGSEDLVASIAQDRFGIGYSGIGYRNDSVAVVPLSEDNPSEVFPPEMQYAYSGEYPLSRFLYLAVNKDPAKPMDTLAREFVEYIFSEQGQRQVMKDGFFPVSSKIVSEEKTKLGM